MAWDFLNIQATDNHTKLQTHESDFQRQSPTLHMTSTPGGHGSGYIQQTGHLLNSSSLREESAAWPLSAWCSDGTTLSPY